MYMILTCKGVLRRNKLSKGKRDRLESMKQPLWSHIIRASPVLPDDEFKSAVHTSLNKYEGAFVTLASENNPGKITVSRPSHHELEVTL